MYTEPHWRLMGPEVAAVMIMVSVFKYMVVNSGDINCKTVEKALSTIREVQINGDGIRERLITAGWRNRHKLSGRCGICMRCSKNR